MPHYTGRFAYSPDPGLNLLLDHWQRGDCVAFESIDRLGYFAVRGGDVSDAVAFEDNGSSFERLGAPERIQRELPVLEAHCRRLWYVQDGQKPGHLLEQALTRSATLKRQWHTASGLVQLYIPVHPPSLAGLSTL